MFNHQNSAQNHELSPSIASGRAHPKPAAENMKFCGRVDARVVTGAGGWRRLAACEWIGAHSWSSCSASTAHASPLHPTLPHSCRHTRLWSKVKLDCKSEKYQQRRTRNELKSEREKSTVHGPPLQPCSMTGKRLGRNPS